MEDTKLTQNKDAKQQQSQIKKWQAPKLYDLEASDTEFGGGSVLSDVSNTSSATRSS